MSKSSKVKTLAVTHEKKATSVQKKEVGIGTRSVLVIAFVLSFVLYGNTLRNGYAMDDELVTLNQKNVEQGIYGISSIFTSRYSVNTKQNYEYRPLVLLTYAIEYQFFGRNAGVSHFINILFYALLCFLIYKTFLKLFGDEKWQLSLLIMLLFLVHPIHNEVVASLKNRDELLTLIFTLLSLKQLLKFSENGKYSTMGYAILLMTAAVMAKKSVLPFFIILPFILIYYKRVKVSVKTATYILSPLVCIILFRLITGMFVEPQTVDGRELYFFENPLYEIKAGIGGRIFFALATVGYYFKMFFAPYPMVCYYGYNTLNGFTFSIYHVIGVIGVCAMLYLFYKNYKHEREISLGLFWLAVCLAAFSNLIKPMVGIVAERFVFGASLGFCIIAAAYILKLKSKVLSNGKGWLAKFNGTQRAVMVIYTIVSVIIILPRNTKWFSHSILYKTDVALYPNSAKLHSLVGTYYATRLSAMINSPQKPSPSELQFTCDSAVSHFRKALEICPNYIAVNNNLGAIYFSYQAKYDSAVYFFKKAINYDTSYVEAYFNLANSLEYYVDVDKNKLNLIQSVNTVSDSSVFKRIKNEIIIGLLDKNESNLLTLNIIKVNFQKMLMAILQGKGSSKNRENMIRGIEYYHEGFSSDFKAKFSANETALKLVNTITQENFQRMASNPELYVDSVVNKIYLPLLSSHIGISALGLSQQFELIKWSEQSIKRRKMECIGYIESALRFKPDYIMAYNKLATLYEKWKMPDQFIRTNDKVYKVKGYKKFTLDFGYARAYLEKQDYKKVVSYLTKAMNDIDKILIRYKKAAGDFTAAGNNTTAIACMKSVQMNRSNAGGVVNGYVNQLKLLGRMGEAEKLRDRLAKFMGIN